MKKTLLLSLVCFVHLSVFSQSFMNGVGLVGFHQSAPGRSAFSAFGFTYNPRFNFLEMGNSSLSVGIPMSLAVNGTASYSAYDSYYGTTNSVSAMVNLPLMLNYNIGSGATRLRGQHFGFFVGAGAGYHMSADEYVDKDGYDYSNDVSGFGPAANIGVRFGVGRRSKNIELRGSWMKLMESSKSTVGGIATIFNF